MVYGRAGDSDEIIDPVRSPLRLDGDVGRRWRGQVHRRRRSSVEPGPFGYTVRVLPWHRLLAGPAELGLVTVPGAPAGMVNGDLR